jgi:hypothetical protein
MCSGKGSCIKGCKEEERYQNLVSRFDDHPRYGG